MSIRKKIAVVGAGLAGLTVARELNTNHDVTVFEKSRGYGGRMATRYHKPFEFDHGAQFFLAKTDEFQRFLRPLIDAGVVAPWFARFAEMVGNERGSSRRWDDSYPHYVGVPRMNAIGRYLATDIDVRTGVRVASVAREDGKWVLDDATGQNLGLFDWLVVTAPSEQTAALLPDCSALQSRATQSGMLACFAMMVGFDSDQKTDWDAALVREADISWVSRNSSKPGRPRHPAYVVHATNAWAAANFDLDVDIIRDHMSAELKRVSGIDTSGAMHCAVHKWRFANTGPQNGPASAVDVDQQLGVCGDWLVRGRVEAAFCSAHDLLSSLQCELQK